MTDAHMRAWPQVSTRVQELHAQMRLEEKLAQLVGFWIDHGDEVVAPLADEMTAGAPERLAEVTEHGIGHFTRVYGTRPVDPAERARWLWEEQRRLLRETRLGIPALVHEECLTGLAAWKAACFPTPLAWGAAFDPDLVEEMASLIGSSLRTLGVHQGLAPVLDVIRDPRWGRTEEAISEDPYVVGTVGTAYVRGLQSAGIQATLKHFVGYSGSRAGRNHAPVSAGPRELADVFLLPFEMAVLDGGARSVMNAYNDIDGIPLAAHTELLTGLLREEWGFDGTVVSDYFSVAFLALMHGVAADRGHAAAMALEAGIDVELPSGDAFLEPLAALVRAGEVDETLIDRAVLRALSAKEELGLLDEQFTAEPPTVIDLDTPAHRDVARRLAEESAVLLSNDGILPLAETATRLAVIGPNADRAEALMGCYSFPNHVLAHHPDVALGIEVPTIAEALRAELGSAEIEAVRGCEVEGTDTTGIAAAVEAASRAEIAVVVAGDQAGLFGKGTVGEGNDSESLDLPGVQRELIEAVVATGTPTVLVLVTGRPYAIGWALDGPTRPAAVLQTFFPGEEGGPAIARVLTGAVNPSGRLPLTLPRSAGAQPYTYLHPILGGPSGVTSADSTPVRPFGFGLSYTTFGYVGLAADRSVEAGGTFEVAVTVTNLGDVAGVDVVQLYGRDLLASVARPVSQLLGYQRVALEPGESATVRFEVPTTRLAFTARDLTRVVEPGEIEVWVAASSGEKVSTVVAEGIAEISDVEVTSAAGDSGVDKALITFTGEAHQVSTTDQRLTTATVSP
ncbi:glycoside hydrolase family 3 N-terminal domain-containing protein [Nocardioides albus]|uniref:Beta-glucosidase n=1 Tax=Nocardioides albus TaxID=1841 RepID=A0A7W5A966_9ACTN|nr:glycoside hydrolase family 3 N-terminal domain-containing protein [Nocardioides albus]MBB3091815.1 beta-glucosidase [Nocardioides albus]GGU31676.1 beta-glucosidase [Nocardioides albus]